MKRRAITEAAFRLSMHKLRERGTVTAFNVIECFLDPTGKHPGPGFPMIAHHLFIPGFLPQRPIVLLLLGKAISKTCQAAQHLQTPIPPLRATAIFLFVPEACQRKISARMLCLQLDL